MQRVAIIFDDTQRPETTGTYCRMALEELVRAGRLTEVEHVLTGEIDRIAPGRFDLHLYVDDGMACPVRPDLRPSAWWAIDTHLSFEFCLARAREVDHPFSAQTDAAELMRAAGVSQAAWLPLGCDPQVHGRVETPDAFDVAFVGHQNCDERKRLCRLLQDTFPRSFMGESFFRDVAKIYSSSKTIFNRSVLNDVNMRVFEGLCSGSLLVTNDLTENGQADLFKDGVHCATYRSDDELLDKLRFYLSRDAIRVRIAEAGRDAVLQRHTYRHRMESILKVVESAQPSTHVAVPAAMPAAPAARSRTWFELDRPDVLELVPPTARLVLHVGCGGGRLGAALRERQRAYVVGVETDAEAASHAGDRLDEVVVGDVAAAEIDFPPATFDCVICADILERLRDPAVVLHRIRQWLKPEGTLVACVANARHHSVLRGLVEGNWTYDSAGALDAEHVRLFTHRELEKLLYRSGFELSSLARVLGAGAQEWIDGGRPCKFQIGPMQAQLANAEDAADLFATGFLATAAPRPQRAWGLTSIVIVVHNEWMHTRACLDSIRLRTDERYELIVIDNGSDDRTREYLESCSDVRLIVNDTNRGFPAAANQGVAAAHGEQILLLNNDTIVTTGWLRRLLAALHGAPDVGVTGPVSNYVSGPQQVLADYEDLSLLDGFAWERSKLHDGERTETDRLVGFCLLARREVFDQVGLLDERFGIGNFEDDDLCRRARQAGFRCLIAHDAFVHHVGSATFRGSGIDLGQVLRENERLYRDKWQSDALPLLNANDLSTDLPRRLAAKTSAASSASDEAISQSGELSAQETAPATAPRQPHTTPSTNGDSRPAAISKPPDSRRPALSYDVDDDGLLVLKENTVRLSACLIVRDNERTIRPCLDSLRPWVDEIVVVDTGSVDATAEICREAGARVFHWAWRDDFAAARNQSLSHAWGEWIFCIDSDDTLPAECGRRLRELALREHPDDLLGFVAQVHCPGKRPWEGSAVDHVKLFRNHRELEYEFRIHEQILPAIRRAGGRVEWTDIHVVHSGADRSPAGWRRKYERDLRILKLEQQARPDHPFVLFNFGMTYLSQVGDELRAAESLRRCLKVSDPQDSHLRKAYALLVEAETRMGRADQASEVCRQGLALFPDDLELRFRRALLDQSAGRFEVAEAGYLDLIEGAPAKRYFYSLDFGINDYMSRHNLAALYESQGRTEDAERAWRALSEKFPEYAPGWFGLGVRLLVSGHAEEARTIAAQLEGKPDGAVLGMILRARCHEDVDEDSLAVEALEAALAIEPESIDIHRGRCRILCRCGPPEKMVAALRQLLDVDPKDAAAWHNLGSASLLLRDFPGAVEAFNQSLVLRPDAEGTARQRDWAARMQTLDPADSEFVTSVAEEVLA